MTTITIDRAVVEQTLEALELGYDTAKAEADRYHTAMAGFRPERHAQMDAEVQQIAAAITALRAALAQEQAEPVQPVAKVELMKTGGNAGLATRIVEIDDHLRERLRPGQLLYTVPPKAEPLTEEEILRVKGQFRGTMNAQFVEFARAVERAHGIGRENE